MRTENEPRELTEKDLARAHRLSAASDTGNGAHGQYLTGIRVSFDLTFSVKAWTEAERYRFLEFVTSQSTMHRITKFDLETAYMEHVDSRIIDIMKEKVSTYNEILENYNSHKDEKSEEWKRIMKERLDRMYLEILYSNPCGFRLTARMTTNYRCLKNIYIQRKSHRLPEWKEFCDWITTLPYFEELINTNKN